MNKLVILYFLALCSSLNAQYYYKDIVAANDLTRLMNSYKTNGIHKVTSTGITSEGQRSNDFNETQDINNDFTQLKVTTRINKIVSSLLHRFDQNGRLLSSADSSSGVKSTSTYTYNNDGKITSINNRSVDADSTGSFTQSEEHIYLYNNGKPEKMWRVINKTDSLEVRFVSDDNGNIIEERNFRRGKAADPIYYYYDGRNRLTDIVRYNYKAKRLLPDFLFEYDEQNRVIQKITTTSAQNIGYLTWRYLFNDKGLKTKEALFNKEKVLQGRIDYNYN